MSELAAAFRRMVARLEPGLPAVAEAAELVLEALADGHSAIDLAALSPDAADQLGRSALVGDGRGSEPLVVSGGLLYLAASFRDEEAVAARLRALAAEPVGVDEARLAATVSALFPPAMAQPEQQAAVAAAARRRLAVLAGGPGTGKTTTVVRVLAAIIDQELAAGRPAPRVLLMAPTGKAAARLGASVGSQRAGLVGVSEAVRAALPGEATTLHRALGAQAGWRVAVRHGPDRPWPADVVVIDEASMVELSLLAAALAALEPGARLILVGDPDQLASVGAGSALADLVGLTDGPVAGCVHRLVRSQRFAAGGAIAAAASAVLRGDGPGVVAAADGVAVRLAAPSPEGLVARAVAGWTPFCRAVGAAEKLAALDRFRVLCALRQGPLGSEAVGRLIEARLRSAGALSDGGRQYDGRPILITANDAAIRLQNGDTGVIVSTTRGLRAAFFDEAGGVRELLPGRLPPHETAFAMTVHKSQGSEFDEVVVVLPDAPSPLLTRELLYTGLTRAKREVTVYTSADRLHEAVGARVTRRSGLAARLGRAAC